MMHHATLQACESHQKAYKVFFLSVHQPSLLVQSSYCRWLPMLAVLSVFWSCKGTANATNFVEDFDCCPRTRPAAKITTVSPIQ